MADSAPTPRGSEQDKLQTSVEAVETKIVDDAKKAGIPSYQADSDTAAAERAAEPKESLPPGLDVQHIKDKMQKGSEGTAIITDIGDSNNGTLNKDLPPPEAPPLNGTTNGTTNGASTAPAAPTKPEHKKAGDGNWEGTGWEPRFGSLNDALDLDGHRTDHQTWIEANLDEKYFGDWYHNGGVIAFAVLATWIITLLRGGLAWIILIGACCATYYRTSIRRVRRNVRDEVNREMQKFKLESDVESLEWMNSFVVKFWPIYAPVMHATIINTVDSILAGQTPGFLDSIKLTTFTLGTKPPRIEHVKTYPKTDDDLVEMDWAFSFTPNDTADLTSRQLANKVNPKVILEVRVGKGIASKGIPIVVQDMSFSGIMKVRMKLQIPFPHIEKVDVCFLGRPTFDYVLKPVGGETFGIDIGFLPGLNSFIQEQIHGNLGPMFYSPNMFTVEVAKMLGGAPIDTAIGVLAVTIHRARGLKNPDKFSGTPDPYTSLSINQRVALARTKTVHENADPKWNETHYIIITNLNDSLDLSVMDYNDIRKDKELGVASFPLQRLTEQAEHEGVELPVQSNGKTRGQLSFDVRFFPVLEGAVLEDGTKQPPPESNSGIVRFTISQCKDLDASKSMVGQLSPYAIMTFNGKTVATTKSIKRNNNPSWEESHEMLVTNRNNCALGVIVKDERGFVDDPVVGKYQIKLKEFLDSIEKGNDWFNLQGARSGRVKMRVQWKPVAIKGILGGTGGYVTPIGVMRLHFQSASNLRNLEKVGKSDPYARVMLNGFQKARTVTFENDLNPEWDEVLYVPVHSEREKLMIEVMDQESMGKDRSLGMYELDLKEFITLDTDGLYQVHAEKQTRKEGLMLKKSLKGTIQFTAAFYPCLNVSDPEEEERERKEKELEHDSASTSGAVSAAVSGASSGAVTPVKSTNSATLKPDGSDGLLTPLTPTFSAESKGPPKLHLSPEELLKHESGLLIFKILEGEFSRKDVVLDILMDDHAFPSYTTSKIRTKSVKFNEIGDAVVRELDFSRITLRLREHDEKNDDDDKIKAKLTGNTMETLQQCLNNPTVLTLKGKDAETHRVKVSLKYLPLLMQLDPSESINNMGTLRVDVLDAANLPSADRNGKSDPFCVFELDGKEVHKTKVQKKTLHPAWNEVFETEIASRTAANLTVDIFDWDLGSKADFLAKTKISLRELEPFKPQTFHYTLLGKNDEEGKFGELRLRMVFKPAYVVRSRQGSSTFHGTFAVPGKIVTGVAGAPLKVGGFAVGGVTKGAKFVGKNTFGRLLSRDKDEDQSSTLMELEEEAVTTPSFDPEMEASASRGLLRPGSSGSALRPTSAGSALRSDNASISDSAGTAPKRISSLAPPQPAIHPNGGSVHNRSRSTSSQLSVPGVIPSNAETGTATVRIVSAIGFGAGINLQLRVRTVSKGKDAHKTKTIKTNSNGEVEFGEEFKVECRADEQFRMYAKDNHMIKDLELGEGLFVVDDTGSGQDTVVPVGNDGGKVILRTSFRAADVGTSPGGKKRGLLRR